MAGVLQYRGATVPRELFIGGGCEGERAAARVLAVVGIEIVREGEGGGCCRVTVPAMLQYRGHCSQIGSRRQPGAGNAGRGASPTAGKREGISF